MSNILQEADQLFKDVEILKSDADADRDFGDYESAIGYIDQAISKLTRFRQGLSKATSGIDERDDIDGKTASRLSDFYGARGGVLRRMGKLQEAEASYCLGANIEDEYRLDATYNRTNVIVLELLRQPARIASIQPRVESARDALTKRTQGKEKNHLWSQADLGLLHLLSIDRPVDERLADAKAAYEAVRTSGAEEQHYQSILDVLNALAASLKKVAPAIEATILMIIEFIDDLKSH